MIYYHCSPIGGLRMVEPRIPNSFDKPARVYMTTLLPMALMYGIRNYEYTYGYTREGQIYFEEYFPNALELLYRGKTAYLYMCDPGITESTNIPNEVTSEYAVAVSKQIFILDVCEALLEQEKEGKLIIRRYHELSPKMLEWILREETAVILRKDLLQKETQEAEYYRVHYPEAWEAARRKTGL